MRRVFLLGDSISIGYAPFLRRFVDGHCAIQQKSGMEESLRDLNAAIGANGGDSGHCLSYLQAMVPCGRLQADLLLLNCGLHDIKCQPGMRSRQVSAEVYRENLCAILTLAREAFVPVLWVRTTPVEERVHNTPDCSVWRYEADVQTYNAIADEVMAAADVRSVDLHAFTCQIAPSGQRTTDGRHFPDYICELQGAFIAGWLRGMVVR
jgi:lysophospholipase L1-like esterase